MTQEEILLVAGLAGAALLLTLLDLLFSAFRHWRRSRAGFRSVRLDRPAENEAAARSEHIRKRLTAIHEASGGDPQSSPRDSA